MTSDDASRRLTRWLLVAGAGVFLLAGALDARSRFLSYGRWLFIAAFLAFSLAAWGLGCLYVDLSRARRKREQAKARLYKDGAK